MCFDGVLPPEGLIYLTSLRLSDDFLCPCSPRCVYPDRSRQSGDVGWFLWLLWSCSGISVPAGLSEYKRVYRNVQQN